MSTMATPRLPLAGARCKFGKKMGLHQEDRILRPLPTPDALYSDGICPECAAEWRKQAQATLARRAS